MIDLTRYHKGMEPASRQHIRDLIERLARVSASDEWVDDLNPTQKAALAYLARANRYSRSPSQAAEYLAATRGTVSQTLKALARKGLIEERRSRSDRRWISYTITPQGLDALNGKTVIDEVLDSLEPSAAKALSTGLTSLVHGVLDARGNRRFGLCRNCRFHRIKGAGGFCALLEVNLAPVETGQICHEFQA